MLGNYWFLSHLFFITTTESRGYLLCIMTIFISSDRNQTQIIYDQRIHCWKETGVSHGKAKLLGQQEAGTNRASAALLLCMPLSIILFLSPWTVCFRQWETQPLTAPETYILQFQNLGWNWPLILKPPIPCKHSLGPSSVRQSLWTELSV